MQSCAIDGQVSFPKAICLLPRVLAHGDFLFVAVTTIASQYKSGGSVELTTLYFFRSAAA